MISAMNRKERRLFEKKQEKNKSPVKIKRTEENIALAAEAKTKGTIAKAAEHYPEALAFLSKAISLDSSLADAHFDIAMMARNKPDLKIDMGQINAVIKDKKLLLSSYGAIIAYMREKALYKEAVLCQEEICRLDPDNALALMDLGLLLNLCGDGEPAAVIMSRALMLDPSDTIVKGCYAASAFVPKFTQFHPEIKQALLECFKNPYDVLLRSISSVWLNLIMFDPEFRGFANARIITDFTLFSHWADSLDESTGAFLKDPYLLGGLRRLLISDHLVENVLTYFRRYICVSFDTLVENGRFSLFEPFLYALAEQCFFNEYIYAQDNLETQIVENLRGKFDKRSIGLLACYRPLYQELSSKKELLHNLSKEDNDFKILIRTQLDEPLEEERLKQTIPVFGEFANQISQAVQAQYEENPYPRWTTVCKTPLPTDDNIFSAEQRNLPFKILIAGCGTGRQAISTAVRNPNSHVTAIDLSRTSIAYGLRKAKEIGIDNRINFVHADILSMKDWPEDFDIIECSGVLHHMEDPFLGWQTLVQKLRSNGCMKIGLYSEIARKPVVQARELIKNYGFLPTPEGIRAARKAIFELPVDHPIHKFVSISADFYSTSSVRDLVFHVQEHRMTLPQIKEMIDRLGLFCFRFVTSSPALVYKYDKMFPEDSNRRNLSNWEKIEREDPLAFAGMYQFWVQKTAN